MWQKAVDLPVQLCAGLVRRQLEMVIIATEAEITATAITMCHSEVNRMSSGDFQAQTAYLLSNKLPDGGSSQLRSSQRRTRSLSPRMRP